MKEKFECFKKFLKENSIIGPLLILFSLFVIATWLIVPGLFSGGQFLVADRINPLGFLDLFRAPASTFVNSFHFVIFILLIGALYGLINKTGVYGELVKRVGDALQGKVLYVSIVFFAFLNAMTGNIYLLFVLMPFFWAIIFHNKYDKLTALAATVGALLLGNVVSLFHSIFLAAFNFYYGIGYEENLLIKIIIFVVLLVIYSLFVNHYKKTVTKKEKFLLLDSRKKAKASLVNMLIVLVTIFSAFLFVVMYDWYHSLSIDAVKEASITMLDNNIIANILGRMNLFGQWGLPDLTIMMLVFMALIIFVFKIELKKAAEGFTWGLSQMLKPAVFVSLALILYYSIIALQGDYNIYNSIINFIMTTTGDYEILGLSIASLFSSLFFFNIGEFLYISQNFINSEIVTASMAVTIQAFYALGLFILPTSMFLVAGLVALNVSYYDWLKYIYKFLIIKLVIIIILIYMLSTLL